MVKKKQKWNYILNVVKKYLKIYLKIDLIFIKYCNK